MKTFLTSLTLKVLTGDLRREEGQGALEYLGILIGLVALVFVAFQIIGVNILSKATSFVTTVLNGS